MKKLYWYYPHLKFMMGGTKFILEIASRVKNKYDITLLCNLGDKDVIRAFEKKGIKVQQFSTFSTNSIIYWAFLPFFVLYDLIAVFKYLKRADVILATLYPANFVCLQFSVLTGKPYFYYCYEPYPFFHSTEFKKSFGPLKRISLEILTYLYGWSDVLATRRATKVLTLNEVTKKTIKKVYRKESTVTLMGVDTKHFRPHSDNKIKKKFKNKILITHSTDYTYMKRTDLAIKTISHLVKKYPNLLLVVTSTQPNSPEKNKLMALANELRVGKNIHFAGLVSYNDLPLYYGSSLVYLSCSIDASLGTTSSNMPVKESLACETPAIRANITTEDVEDGVSGYLVNPEETEKVAKKIEYLIKNPGKAKEMGKRGRKKIEKIYKWEKVAETVAENLQ